MLALSNDGELRVIPDYLNPYRGVCGKTMTAILAAVAQDGIVMASDDQVTGKYEGLKSDEICKLVVINQCCVGIAGSGMIGKTIVKDTLEAKKIDSADTPIKIAKILQSKAVDYYKTNGLPLENRGNLRLNFILAGFDEGNPEIWLLQSDLRFAPTLTTLPQAMVVDCDYVQVIGTPLSQGIWDILWGKAEWDTFNAEAVKILLTSIIRMLGGTDLGVGINSHICAIESKRIPEIGYTKRLSKLTQQSKELEKWFEDEIMKNQLTSKIKDLATQQI